MVREFRHKFLCTGDQRAFCASEGRPVAPAKGVTKVTKWGALVHQRGDQGRSTGPSPPECRSLEYLLEPSHGEVGGLLLSPLPLFCLNYLPPEVVNPREVVGGG